MQSDQKFFITTAISYTNGAPHIGHAYEVIAADSIARFKNLSGYDVFFTTGTDEHGQKVQRSAESLGLKMRDYVDQQASIFRKMAESMDCNFDLFIRTSDPSHTVSAQELWRRMEAQGDIYLSRYAGWYSVRDESFYDDSEISVGKDGIRYHGETPLEWVEEESYFFRLSAYEDKLLALYEREKAFILPASRRNEIVSFVKGGLKDLSISRTAFSWGVPVPGNENHVMYVWVDALDNYLTVCGFPDTGAGRWKYWPADLHVVGKDIIRFHAVYWPAFLMSANLPLPRSIFGHGFLLHCGEKMSKSLGNVVDPFVLVERYGVDQVRYFLLRDVPFGQDGNYSHEALVQRINADLANDLGNLAQRSLSMISRNLEGMLPEPGVLSEDDQLILDSADSLFLDVQEAMNSLAPHTALEKIWRFISRVNRYFTVQEPWSLKKNNPERMKTILYVTAESIRQIGILSQPFIPAAAGRLLDLLAVSKDSRSFSVLGMNGRLVPSLILPEPQPIFPRYQEKEGG